MHRSTEPHSHRFDQTTALSVLVRSRGCIPETEDDTPDDFRPLTVPITDKPSLIRMTRGHRNWMTHLPLSRPDD